ncbi:MAG TPA: hypothetical protein VFI62_03330, partial [Burkholderiales bacterium]|nr:hypothetical protein [Burkholderiales bacterium]
VLILGKGGMGKSRLIEEVLRLGGHPGPDTTAGIQHQRASATQQGDVLFSQIIDMSDLRLHTRSLFLRAIRDGLTRRDGADFRTYDAMYTRYQNLREQGAEYAVVHDAGDKAQDAFMQDYRKNATQRRIVWVIDTAEQFAINSSHWPIERHLLKAEDIVYSSQLWLLERIRNGELPNTTILLAGREIEGAPFLDTMRAAVSASDGRVQLTELKLEPFAPAHIQTYFQHLARDWQQRAEQNPEHARYQTITTTMRRLADNWDRIQVLWLYTGGQPVRLSLYADLIIEGPAIPERLNTSFAQAKAYVGTDDPIAHPTELLERTRKEIEAEFIALLFA